MKKYNVLLYMWGDGEYKWKVFEGKDGASARRAAEEWAEGHRAYVMRAVPYIERKREVSRA